MSISAAVVAREILSMRTENERPQYYVVTWRARLPSDEIRLADEQLKCFACAHLQLHVCKGIRDGHVGG